MDMQQRKMLRQIQELEFTALELNLYLDTHPEDQEALKRFNEASSHLVGAIRMYEERYGPLLNYGLSGPVHDNEWPWINDPWPWEI